MFIKKDTAKCQFLYELQESVYLDSDVTAYLHDVEVEQVGKDRYANLHYKTSAIY